MPTRIRHQMKLSTDRDLVQVGLVTLGVFAATAGLAYFAYFAHVVYVARRAPIAPLDAEKIFLFGKHSPSGELDMDFEARIARAVELHTDRPVHWVFLGGGVTGQPSEAEIAFQHLQSRGVDVGDRFHLEAESRDTLQNLRNARDLIGDKISVKVALLSSRYHLARCQVYARNLGFKAELCAAEPSLRWTFRNFFRLAGEAGYVMLSDIGTKWAKLTRNKRMLDRVT